MATMKDIAKLAGVSTSTVSHVINKTRFVSEEISERVNNAAKELNYYAPSALARSLKVNRTKTIGMLVTTSTNPFFGEVVKGVERSCYQKGYSLILCNTEGDNERMRQSINTLLQKRVDGLILMCSLEGERIDVFERYPDIPVVVMDWGPMLFTSDKIQDNSLRGGYLAAKYLIDCGHTEIGCITGPLIKHQAQMRYEGYKRAMNEAGLEFNANWIIESDFECEGGYQAFKKMAQRGALPSSIFVSNDMMAMGVINAANELDIKVPDDLSIIGYDDIHIAKFMSPSLTTIHQPKYRLGQAAVETLVRKLDDKSNDAQVVQLEPTLVVRNSVTNFS